MKHVIENQYLKATIEDKGAQILSLESKENGKEYIWNGDEGVWKWHAPILFPQCGDFPNGYLYNRRNYKLPMHGFLRDVEHTYLGEGVFIFASDNREDYPFSFKTQTSFTLEEHSLTHSITITNTSELSMPMSLGFHTGFLIQTPLLTFSSFEDELGCDYFKCNDNTLSDTKLYTRIKSRKIDVRGDDGKRMLLSFSDFTTLVLWTPKGKSKQLVCIEPRIDTVPTGAKEPFAISLKGKESITLSETILIIE